MFGLTLRRRTGILTLAVLVFLGCAVVLGYLSFEDELPRVGQYTRAAAVPGKLQAIPKVGPIWPVPFGIALAFVVLASCLARARRVLLTRPTFDLRADPGGISFPRIIPWWGEDVRIPTTEVQAISVTEKLSVLIVTTASKRWEIPEAWIPADGTHYPAVGVARKLGEAIGRPQVVSVPPHLVALL